MVLAVAAAIAMTVVMWIHVQRIEAEAPRGSFIGCKDGEGVVVPVQCSFQCTLPNSSLNHIQVRVRCGF